MRTVTLAIAIACGIGLIGVSGAWAAAANASMIAEAARAVSPITKVPCAMRRVCNRYGCRSVRRCW